MKKLLVITLLIITTNISFGENKTIVSSKIKKVESTPKSILNKMTVMHCH